MKIKVKMNPISKILRDKGLLADGRIQMFHTQNVLRRLQRYMKFNTGNLYKLTVIQTDIRKPLIVTEAPHARYQFHGKKMIDPELGIAGFMTPEGWRSRANVPKVRTNIDLKHEAPNKSPRATARWDKALSANEGPVMAAELQRYINHLGRSRK